MKIYKKVIAVGLVGAIGQSSILSADIMSDLGSDNFMNVTPAGHYNINGRDIYSSGSAYFRFGPSAINYEPIYHISPPEIQASCSGFNLKGLFVSMLGLDRISKMLKSAGASFAWGVVVGLVYSLPGIFSAFKMLDNWAKKIMSLLQNSCATGVKLGKALAKKHDLKGMQEEWIEKPIQDHVGKIPDPDKKIDFVENAEQGISDFFGIDKDWYSADSMSGSSETEKPSPAERADFSKALIMAGQLNTDASTFMDSLFFSSYGKDTSRLVDFYIKLVGSENKNMIDSTNLVVYFGSDPKVSENAGITPYKLISIESLVSDLIPSGDINAKIKNYNNYFKALMFSNMIEHKVIDTSSSEAFISISKKSLLGALNTNEDKSSIESAKSGNVSIKKVDATIQSGYTTAEKFGEFVALYFFKSENADTVNNLAKVLANKLKPLSFTAFKAKEGKTSANSLYFISESTKPNKVNLFGGENEIDTTGILVENQSETLQGRTFSAIQSIVEQGTDIQAAFSENNVPILTAPGVKQIKILKQTPASDRLVLMNQMADTNVCLFGLALLSSTTSSSLTSIPTTNAFSISPDKLIGLSVFGKATSDISNSDNYKKNKILNSYKRGILTTLNKSLRNSSIGTAKEMSEGDMISKCNQLIKSTKIDFEAQDNKNRKRASSLSKQN